MVILTNNYTNMFKKLTTLTTVLLLVLNYAAAQTLEEFPENKMEFLKAMDEFMNAQKREDCKETFGAFETYILTNRLDDNQFKEVRGVANKMLGFKMRPHPYFESYLRSINNMIESKQTDKFGGYHTTLNSLLDNLKRSTTPSYKNYTNFAADLFGKRAIRYVKSGSIWLTSNDDYFFGYKEDNPIVKFSGLDLIGVRKKDTIYIKGTSGSYLPLDNFWKGRNGKVTWERTELGEDVYCEFKNYSLETNKTGYSVDTVTLYYPSYFPNPVQGSFEDRIIAGAKKEIKSYPRFESFTKVMELNNIGEGIKYKGGFKLTGDDVNGYGNDDDQATMMFYSKGGKLAIAARAENFVIRKSERILSAAASVSIYHGEDSIFHPRINFKFDVDKRQLTLSRGATGIAKAPFYNSYHKFEIDAEKIDWQIDSDSIEIGKEQKVGTKRDVVLESVAFYNEERYRRYQNIATTHPISQIRIYSEEVQSRFLDGEALAKRLNPRYELGTILGLLTDLMEGGFIIYNPDKKEVEVKDKIFHWADASVEKTDYDVIRILSNNDRKTNGRLNITSNDMILQGVKNVILSDSQLVVIKPSDSELRIKKDRDMDFDGSVNAGYCIFKGTDFHFKYQDFYMTMDTVNSLTIRYEFDRDVEDVPLLKEVTTRIEDMSGHLQLDAPQNKSGRENDEVYASFVSKTKAKAYYDNRRIQDGAYKRDSFYFELEPFTFDSLNSFDPLGLVFDGEMYTADIFPPFDEKLKIQEYDNSLGFTTKTPPGGFPAYNRKKGGVGTYNNNITLNGTGLLGNGKLNYINSSMESDSIVFLPEQMKAEARTFNIEERRSGVEYPEVNATDVFVDWAPYEDSMYIKSDDVPFNFFNNEKLLDGDLVLTPGGLYGSGTLDWDDATMSSRKLLFGFNGVDADTADLSIKAIEEGQLAFNTKNVKTSLDFESQMGVFEKNSDEISTEMPYNQYKTSMDQFTWDMKNEKVIFASKSGKKGEFLSIHPKQDSLIFQAQSGVYDLKNNLLEVEGVDHIKVADAMVYLDEENKNLNIRAEANMDALENATIVANTENRYHKIVRAKVKVNGRNNYKASGSYAYEVAGQEQEILFNDIVVRKKKGKKEYVTFGSGPVREKDKFLIDNKILFQGSVKLRADDKNLTFKGHARINSPNIPRSGWFSIESKVDRKNVAIAYDEPKNIQGSKLHVGLFVNSDSAHVYPTVMGMPVRRRDTKIFNASGVLKHVKGSKEFVFGDSSKVIMGERRGNILKVDETTGKVTTQGQYNFDEGFKGDIGMKTAGVATIKNGIAKFDLVAGLDIPLPEKLLTIIATDLYGFGDELPDIEVSDNHIEQSMAEFIEDNKKLTKLIEDYNNTLYITLPKENEFPFFFSKLPLKWNENTYSFTSKAVGISSINGRPVEKIVNCLFEVKMLSTNHSMTMYIDSPSDDWYYIHYKNGIITTLSSNEEYSNAVLEGKKKDRVKSPNGEYIEIVLEKLENVRYFSGKMRNN